MPVRQKGRFCAPLDFELEMLVPGLVNQHRDGGKNSGVAVALQTGCKAVAGVMPGQTSGRHTKAVQIGTESAGRCVLALRVQVALLCKNSMMAMPCSKATHMRSSNRAGEDGGKKVVHCSGVRSMQAT